MLRLAVTSRSEQAVVLAVDGRLAGTDVAVLDEEGTRLLGVAQHLVLDLEGLRYIDDTGLALLERWAGERLELRGGSAFVRALLKTRRLT